MDAIGAVFDVVRKDWRAYFGAPVRSMTLRAAACARELLCPRCKVAMSGLTHAGLLGAECRTCRSVFIQPVGTA